MHGKACKRSQKSQMLEKMHEEKTNTTDFHGHVPSHIWKLREVLLKN